MQITFYHILFFLRWAPLLFHEFQVSTRQKKLLSQFCELSLELLWSHYHYVGQSHQIQRTAEVVFPCLDVEKWQCPIAEELVEWGYHRNHFWRLQCAQVNLWIQCRYWAFKRHSIQNVWYTCVSEGSPEKQDHIGDIYLFIWMWAHICMYVSACVRVCLFVCLFPYVLTWLWRLKSHSLPSATWKPRKASDINPVWVRGTDGIKPTLGAGEDRFLSSSSQVGTKNCKFLLLLFVLFWP